MYNIDSQVESDTEFLHSWMYNNRTEFETCHHCKSEFSLDWEEVSESRLDPNMMFCCESCRNKWDIENAHEYEGEVFLWNMA